MRMLLSFVLLLAIAGANAYFAQRRGRDPVGWFLIGLLLGVFGFILLFLMPKVNKKTDLETDEDRILVGLGSGEDNYSSKEWFYLDAEHSQQGPISFEILRKAWEEKKITLQTHVWCEGMEQWEKIGDSPLLVDALTPTEAVK